MKVFASVLGQTDNVGDTVLRRGFLNAIRPAGDLQVFVGTRDDAYLSALGLQDSDTLHRSSGRYRKEIASAILTGRSLYAFNAGELEVRASFARQYLRMAPLLLASRLRGGRVVHTGFGIRSASPWKYAMLPALGASNIVSWRDGYSRDSMGIGRVSPDWAFSLGSSNEFLLGAETDPNRTLLAVSVRYNGLRPDATWVASTRALADRLGLSIIVVAQILRDGPLAVELARELGGESLEWDGPDHARQEAKLREVYRRSRLLLTDRLHGAIMAVTEGAVPLGLAEDSLTKVVRSLDAAGIRGIAVDRALSDPLAVQRIAIDALSRTTPIMRHVIEARRTLDALATDIRSLARGGK